MNENIEVISEDLWLANFDHIKMGWLDDLSLPQIKDDRPILILDHGKFLIDKNIEKVDKSIETLTSVMSLPDDLLGTKKGFYSFMRKLRPKWEKKEDKWIDLAIQYYNLDSIESLYNSFSEWEKRRRKVKAEYIKVNKKPNGIDKIKRLFKRKGV